MFHAFDNPGPNRETSRAEWMALLARAPIDLMAQVLEPYLAARKVEWLRKPETGLYMVQGRAGGTAERFNLGEITVTRCALRAVVSDHLQAPVGVAYVLGRHHRQAELAAIADALLQRPESRATLELELLIPIRQHLALQKARRQAKTASTKVDFFTVAREAETGVDEEEEA